MSIKSASTIKWLYGLCSEVIKGASHIGMVVLSGTGIAQMIDASSAAQQVAQQPLTFKYFILSIAIGGCLKGLAYLDNQPLPPIADATSL